MEWKVPEEEITARIKTCQEYMARDGLDSMLVIHRPDLFYLTGTAQRAFLYLPMEHAPLLLVKSYMERARKESSIGDLIQIGSVKDIPSCIRKRYGSMPATVGLELDVMPHNDFLFYGALFDGIPVKDCSKIILECRSQKSPWEVLQMEGVSRLSALTFEYIKESIRPGLTETEFAGMFEAYARKHGHGGRLRVRDWLTEGYTCHLLSGPATGMVGLLDSPMSGLGTSPAFPCGAGDRVMEVGEPIMIDLNLMLNGYHFDETRMFAIKSMPEKAMKLSEASIDILGHVIGMIRPGLSVSRLYEAAWEKARELGLEEEFLGIPGYKTRYIGHGIGIELVEPPMVSGNNHQPIKEGMVIAFEPKLVSKEGFGAGVESIVLVTSEGPQILSKTPCKVFVVKA